MDTSISLPKHKTQESTISAGSAYSPTLALKSLLSSNLTQALVALLTSKDEPFITRFIDESGQFWWRVDDPRTGEMRYFDSEDEVRIWLDGNQYR